VDSGDDAAWKQMKEANAAGKLPPALAATYFTTPRPIYELYDVNSDPSELRNLSGSLRLANVEKELRVALAEKMMLDFDYLPLPDLRVGASPADVSNGAGPRADAFEKLDADGDGKLSRTEFGADREAADAEKWFAERDADGNGFINRDEFLPERPLTKK